MEKQQQIIKYYQNEGRFGELVLCETFITAELSLLGDERICDKLFHIYNGGNRPDGKIRRSMSVGDFISIDGRVYQCAGFCWNRL